MWTMNRYFDCRVVLLVLCKEYLTVIKFKIPVLLQVKNWEHFVVEIAFLCGHMQEFKPCENGLVFWLTLDNVW